MLTKFLNQSRLGGFPSKLVLCSLGIGRLLIINQPTCSLWRWRNKLRFGISFRVFASTHSNSYYNVQTRQLEDSNQLESLSSPSVGTKFAVGKTISFLTIVVCVSDKFVESQLFGNMKKPTFNTAAVRK